MTKYIRYVVASLCLTTSACCLALLLWTTDKPNSERQWMYHLQFRTIAFGLSDGSAAVSWPKRAATRPPRDGLQFRINEFSPNVIAVLEKQDQEKGRFRSSGYGVYFPLWFPALVSALASVAALRLSRFTLRSALIATTIVAALLGMVVLL